MPIVIPENNIDVTNQPFRGSFQQLMEANIGSRVRVDFLIGSSNTVSQSGVIYAAGLQYFVLHNPLNNTYVACDIYSVKFVHFL